MDICVHSLYVIIVILSLFFFNFEVIQFLEFYVFYKLKLTGYIVSYYDRSASGN